MKKYITSAFIGLMFALPAYASTPQEQYISLLQQVIALLEQQVQVLVAQLKALPVDTVVSTTTPVSFGSVNPVVNTSVQLTNNQTIMNPETTFDCTLTAESNVGAPSSFVNLTWTSNADSAVINNNKVVHQRNVGKPALFGWELNPVSGGTISLPLSSESGEVNTFTAHFVFKGQTKDCSVSVTTQ